jgi:hypothetical protein
MVTNLTPASANPTRGVVISALLFLNMHMVKKREKKEQDKWIAQGREAKVWVGTFHHKVILQSKTHQRPVWST